MVTKGIGPWQSALFVRYQRLSLKATIACFGGFHNLLFGERYNPFLKFTKRFYYCVNSPLHEVSRLEA